jgi:hypothetical protein
MRGRSGHTTGAAFRQDTQKYNLLTVNGWKIIRYVDMNQVRNEFLSDYQKLILQK